MGLPATGMRKMRDSTCGHGVLHRQAAEHEGIARVAADGFDARLQALVGGQFAAQFELADIFLEQADQVRGAVGNRRVDADVGGVGQFAAAHDAVAVAALVVHVAHLGLRDQFAQDFGIGLAAGLLADEDFDDLLEVQQPERQVHVVRRDDLGIFLERVGVFAVHVEQQDMGLRILFQDAAQDQRHGAGLAGAGGAQHGEMLAQHFVDLDHRRNGFVLLDVADADRRVGIAGIGLFELALVGAEDDVAERGIARNAAPEG